MSMASTLTLLELPWLSLNNYMLSTHFSGWVGQCITALSILSIFLIEGLLEILGLEPSKLHFLDSFEALVLDVISVPLIT